MTKSYLYAGNFDLQTTERDYLKSNFPEEEFSVEVLLKGDVARSVTFRVTIFLRLKEGKVRGS